MRADKEIRIIAQLLEIKTELQEQALARTGKRRGNNRLERGRMSNYKIYDGDFGGYCVRDKDDEFVFETDSLETCNLIVSALEKQLNNDWIPVSERLPKKSGYYLCTADWYDIHAKYVIARLVRKVFFCEYSKEFENWYDETGEYKVLAWQPLPEPYKEG